MLAKLKDLAFLALIGLAAGLVGLGMLFGLPLKKWFGDGFEDLSLAVTTQIEHFVADLRVATQTPPQPQHPQIVIVTITEDTLRNFAYRSPINRSFLAEVVKILEQKGAAAVALDIIFDTPTEEQADDALREVFRNAKIPIFVSYADVLEIPETNFTFMNQFINEVTPGYANVVKDPQDGVIRDFFPGRVPYCGFDAQGDPVKCTGDLARWISGLPGEMIKVLGKKPPETITPLVYRGVPEGKGTLDVFRKYPSHNIDKIPAAWLKDKVVFIGAELTDIDLDMKQTPFKAVYGNKNGQVPGVFIHAHAFAQMLDGTSFRKLPQWGDVLLVLGIGVLGALLAKIDIATVFRLVLAFGIIGVLWAAGFYIYKFDGPLIPLVAPSVAFLSAAWVGDIYNSRQDRAQKKFIKDAFSRFLPAALVVELVSNPEALQLKGERREMTFIFTDVAGFTDISEKLPAATLVHVLNQYMEGMVQIVFKHGGMVDKFIGDAVFAIFGAPLKTTDHAQRAVACAIEMDQFADNFKRTCVDEAGSPTEFGLTRIGVHTGMATIGNFGSEQKFDYTALGDSVNAAARMEGLNKKFGTRCAVSSQTKDKTDGFHFRPMASVAVKGKTEYIDIFNPVESSQAATPLVVRYNQAYAAMHNGDVGAPAMFEELHREFPDDSLIKLHLDRLRPHPGPDGAMVQPPITDKIKLDEK